MTSGQSRLSRTEDGRLVTIPAAGACAPKVERRGLQMASDRRPFYSFPGWHFINPSFPPRLKQQCHRCSTDSDGLGLLLLRRENNRRQRPLLLLLSTSFLLPAFTAWRLPGHSLPKEEPQTAYMRRASPRGPAIMSHGPPPPSNLYGFGPVAVGSMNSVGDNALTAR